MTTRQARHNARRRAERKAAGLCWEVGCPRKAAAGRARCEEHLAANGKRPDRDLEGAEDLGGVLGPGGCLAWPTAESRAAFAAPSQSSAASASSMWWKPSTPAGPS